MGDDYWTEEELNEMYSFSQDELRERWKFFKKALTKEKTEMEKALNKKIKKHNERKQMKKPPQTAKYLMSHFVPTIVDAIRLYSRAIEKNTDKVRVDIDKDFPYVCNMTGQLVAPAEYYVVLKGIGASTTNYQHYTKLFWQSGAFKDSIPPIYYDAFQEDMWDFMDAVRALKYGDPTKLFLYYGISTMYYLYKQVLQESLGLNQVAPDKLFYAKLVACNAELQGTHFRIFANLLKKKLK